MPTPTDRLGLITHTLADTFAIQDYTDNWQALDDYPGIFVCTSITRPVWGVNQEGISIYETDTDLIFTWDGTAWQRYISTGHLGGVEVNVDFSTALTTPVEAIAATVTVEAGNRRHLIVVHASGVYNTNGLTELRVFRDGATVLQQWYHQGWTGAPVENYPRPIFASIPDTPAAASVEYSLHMNAVTGVGGTSTIIATATLPLAIDVFEM